MNSGYKIEELIRRLENFADYLEDKIDISERMIIPWEIIHQLAKHFNYIDLIRNLLKRRGFISGFAALVLAEMRDEKSIPVIFKKYIVEDYSPQLKNVYRNAIAAFDNIAVDFLAREIDNLNDDVLYDVIDILREIKTTDAVNLLKKIIEHPNMDIVAAAIYALSEINTPASKRILIDLLSQSERFPKEIIDTLKDVLFDKIQSDKYSVLLKEKEIYNTKYLLESINTISETLREIVKVLTSDSWIGDDSDIFNIVEKRYLIANNLSKTIILLKDLIEVTGILDSSEIINLQNLLDALSEKNLEIVSIFEIETAIVNREPVTPYIYHRNFTIRNINKRFDKILNSLKDSLLPHNFKMTYKKNYAIIFRSPNSIEEKAIIFYFFRDNHCEAYITGNLWQDDEVSLIKEEIERCMLSVR